MFSNMYEMLDARLAVHKHALFSGIQRMKPFQGLDFKTTEVL